MPRGVPLTPQQLADLAVLFAETGNATEVARELGVEPSTVTRNLARLGEQRRAKLQGQALAAGLLRGGEFLLAVLEKVGAKLTSEIDAGEGLDAKGFDDLSGALVRLSNGIARLDEREERRRQARLTRKRTKAETERTLAEAELYRRKVKEGASPEDLLKQATAEEILALLARIREEKARAKEAPPPEPKV